MIDATRWSKAFAAAARRAPPANPPAGNAPPGPQAVADADALVDALPGYGNQAVLGAMRGLVLETIFSAMRADAICPEPSETLGGGFGGRIDYTYTGAATDYRDAFFGAITASAASKEFVSLLPPVVSILPGVVVPTAFWLPISAEALLTDAIRARFGVVVNTSALGVTLTGTNTFVLANIAAAYRITLLRLHPGTRDAIAALSASRQQDAVRELQARAVDSAFIANINAQIGLGGDATNAAVWFLFSYWALLGALGASSIDATISSAMAAGLQVPAAVRAGNWSTGGYNPGFLALSGSDAASLSGARLAANLLEVGTMVVAHGGGRANRSPKSVGNGYAIGYCTWRDSFQFKPVDSCCLGAGTRVLMADGSDRAIETLRVGERLRTLDGDAAIVLIEKPLRGTRTLTQVNDLPVLVTAGHPFRLALADGPRRAALEPWTLMDATPTVSANGVATLRKGAGLIGIVGPAPGTVQTVMVDELVERTSAGSADECLYDILLERQSHCFFVGGPHTYLAVDHESVDPCFHPASTRAVVAALDTCVAHLRQRIVSPAAELPALINRLDLAQVLSPPAEDVASPQDPREGRSPLPGPEYYQRDGEWEPHASMAEICIVRRFGRWLHRQSSWGRAADQQYREDGSHLFVRLFDLEILGDVPVVAGVPVRFELTLDREADAEAALGPQGPEVAAHDPLSIEVVPRRQRRWHPVVSAQCDLGITPERSAVLHIDVRQAGGFGGVARHALEGLSFDGPGHELLVFDDWGRVIGRVAIGLAWRHPSSPVADAAGVARGGEIAIRRAASVAAGRRIGQAMMALTPQSSA